MFRDKAYLQTLLKIALPIIIQYLIMNALSAVDIMMIGQLGDTPVGGVGLANEIFFLLSLMIFGIGSGGAIFSAQFWGKKDIPNLHKVLGLSLVWAMLGGLLFTFIAIFLPDKALHLYTTDEAVIALGSQYLRIVGFCYIPFTITYTFASILRSTQNVRLPMLVSICALSLNTFLNYTLILGNFGFPALGVQGAAIATLISRSLECAFMVGFVYIRKTPVAATLREMFAFDLAFLKRFLKTTAPVVLNEIIWSLGATTYTAVYAHISTELLAAFNIAHTIEALTFVFFMGIGNACAIMVGNHIGAGENQKAYQYGKRSVVISILVAGLLGLVLIFSARGIVSLYNISQVASGFAQKIILISGLCLWIRGANMTVFVGILRSGGDTRFAFMTEMFSMWVIGIPLAFLGAFVFHLPVYWVFLLIVSDELIKFIIGIRRVFSKRWINNLVHNISIPIPVESLAAE